MKNCDFKEIIKLFIVCFVLLKFGSLETAAKDDCPLPQVLHFNPATNKGTCCIPVALPKGYGFKSCIINGTNDTIEVCPMKPVQLYQWDDTTTATEATCMAEMSCLDMENLMIEKCDDHGQNCRKECVCNFPGGYCGTEYFNCIPFPVGCPRNNVQKDCSCRSPGLEPEENSGKSDPGLPNPITSTPITSVKKLPTSPAIENSEKTFEGDQTTDVGIMTGKDNNNNDTKSQKTPEESLSTGSIIGLSLTVIVVIGGLIFVFILRKDQYKQLWGKCKRENKDSAQPRPIQKVLPFKQNSSEDRNEEALSLQRWVTVPDEPAEPELMTQRLLPEVPQMNLSLHFPTLGSSLFDSHNRTADQKDVSDAPERDQTDVKVVTSSENLIEGEGHDSGALEIPQMNLSLHFPTLGSSLFDSHNSTADQQDVSDAPERDQTDVKVANTSENVIEGEGHDSGALENSRLCHVRVEPSLAWEREGEEEQLL